MKILTYALIAFAAALIGLVLAASVLRDALAPWALSLVHAALGATGLIPTALNIGGFFGGELVYRHGAGRQK